MFWDIKVEICNWIDSLSTPQSASANRMSFDMKDLVWFVICLQNITSNVLLSLKQLMQIARSFLVKFVFLLASLSPVHWQSPDTAIMAFFFLSVRWHSFDTENCDNKIA